MCVLACAATGDDRHTPTVTVSAEDHRKLCANWIVDQSLRISYTTLSHSVTSISIFVAAAVLVVVCTGINIFAVLFYRGIKHSGISLMTLSNHIITFISY